jgi:hypothetical protein
MVDKYVAWLTNQPTVPPTIRLEIVRHDADTYVRREVICTLEILSSVLTDLDDLNWRVQQLGYVVIDGWSQTPSGGMASVKPVDDSAAHVGGATDSTFAQEPKLLAHTHGSMAHMSWASTRRRDLIDGVLAVVEEQGSRYLLFTPRGGQPAALPVSSIYAVEKHASALNTIVDVGFVDAEGNRAVVCLVGPRGRMKTIFAVAGYPV